MIIRFESNIVNECICIIKIFKYLLFDWFIMIDWLIVCVFGDWLCDEYLSVFMVYVYLFIILFLNLVIM